MSAGNGAKGVKAVCEAGIVLFFCSDELAVGQGWFEKSFLEMISLMLLEIRSEGLRVVGGMEGGMEGRGGRGGTFTPKKVNNLPLSPLLAAK